MFDNVKELTVGADKVSIVKIDDTVVYPKGLVLYDYLESDGKAFINTAYKPKSTESAKLIVDMQFLDTKGGRVGSYSNSFRFYFGCYNGNLIIGNGSEGNYNHSIKQADTLKHTYILDKNGLTEDSNNIIKFYFYSNKALSSIQLNMPELPNGLGKWKIYKYQCFEDDVLVRNFLPCTYNGQCGMWDTVENRFYGNRGSGQFTVGNED